jgi:hypothetical protein
VIGGSICNLVNDVFILVDDDEGSLIIVIIRPVRIIDAVEEPLTCVTPARLPADCVISFVRRYVVL